MSLNRYAKRRDANEPQLIKDLRKCNLLVRQQDFPDLAVRRRWWPVGCCLLIEIDGTTRNRKRSPKQLEFLAQWQIPRVADVLQVLAAAQKLDTRIAPSVSCTSAPHSVATSSVAAL